MYASIILKVIIIHSVNFQVRGRALFTDGPREQDDIRADRLRFAADLFDSIDRRVAGVTSQDHIATLEVFDAVKLVSLQCGKR